MSIALERQVRSRPHGIDEQDNRITIAQMMEWDKKHEQRYEEENREDRELYQKKFREQ